MKMEDLALTRKVILLSEEICTGSKNGKAGVCSERATHQTWEEKGNNLDSKEKRKFKLGPFQKASKTELNADNYKGLQQQSIQ